MILVLFTDSHFGFRGGFRLPAYKAGPRVYNPGWFTTIAYRNIALYVRLALRLTSVTFQNWSSRSFDSR